MKTEEAKQLLSDLIVTMNSQRTPEVSGFYLGCHPDRVSDYIKALTLMYDMVELYEHCGKLRALLSEIDHYFKRT